jgi:hypothetical protein
MPKNYEMEPMRTIKAWFLIQRVPDGRTAPLRIKQQWLGVPLPLRYDRAFEGPDPRLADDLGKPIIKDDAVDIEVPDALQALRLFGHTEAATFWENWSMHYFGSVNSYSRLLFNLNEGILLPIRLARMRVPQIENFVE